MLSEPVEQGPLAFDNLRMRDSQIEPFGPIDFRKALHLFAPRRPFDLEGIAPDGANVDVAFDSESDHPLAGTLANLAERLERRRGENHARLLRELPAGGFARVLVGIHFAFRNGPGAVVL